MFLSTLRQHCLRFLHIRGGNVKRNPLYFPPRQTFSEFKRSVLLFTKNVAWCGLVPRSESGATMRRLHLPLRCLKSCSAACVPFLNQYATTSSSSSSSFVLFQPLRPQAVSPTPPARFLQLPDECGAQSAQHPAPPG